MGEDIGRQSRDRLDSGSLNLVQRRVSSKKPKTLMVGSKRKYTKRDQSQVEEEKNRVKRKYIKKEPQTEEEIQAQLK